MSWITIVRAYNQNYLKLRVWWKLLWMSRAQREKARAMQQLLGNLLANAPTDKIAAGEGCSWSMTEDQKAGTIAGLTNYVKAVKEEKGAGTSPP